MFGRKEKAAIAALPPQHQALITSRILAVTQSPQDWNQLFASLSSQPPTIRKHPLPPRTMDVVVPLLRIIGDDMEPTDGLGVRADLRGADAADKVGPGHSIQSHPPISHLQEFRAWDPWLVVDAPLRDKSHLVVTLVDTARIRKYRKRSASGKTKLKSKKKGAQRITVKLTLPRGRTYVTPNPSPATSFLQVSVKPKHDRWLVVARAKYPLPDHPQPGWQLNTIMLVLAEAFRWVAPAPEESDQSHGRHAVTPTGGATRAIRTCTATTGFFVLERCGRNARASCGRCQRSICNRHSSVLPGEAIGVCPECFAAARGRIDDMSDPMWSIGYRRNFYWEVSSSTGDPSWWSEFDSFDNEAFAISAAEADFADDGFDGGADYLDS